MSVFLLRLYADMKTATVCPFPTLVTESRGMANFVLPVGIVQTLCMSLPKYSPSLFDHRRKMQKKQNQKNYGKVCAFYCYRKMPMC